jgi:hypothetical protein
MQITIPNYLVPVLTDIAQEQGYESTEQCVIRLLLERIHDLRPGWEPVEE